MLNSDEQYIYGDAEYLDMQIKKGLFAWIEY